MSALFKPSPREIEIAFYVSKGLTNAEIGAKLNIESGTAMRHIYNLMWKLELRNRTQVALWYLETHGELKRLRALRAGVARLDASMQRRIGMLGEVAN